jgi:hypothetical protein
VFNKFNKRSTAGIAALVIAVVAGAGAYAFTAGNAVADHYAGAGSAKVSGYAVSNIAYTDAFATDGSSTVTAVGFTLDNAADTVKVALLPDGTAAADADLTDCTSSNTTDWTCTFATPVANDQTAASLDQRLFVVATQGDSTITLTP